MASTYTNDLRLELIATGEAAATWGDKTNVNLTNIAAAFGYATQDGFAANADSTTTVADGAADPARAMYFKVTSSATLTATRTLTIAPNTISRVMWIENATTGGQSIAISQGTGANVTILTGKTAVVYLDGAGSGAAVVDAMAGVDPGVTDTLAEILAAGNTTGGTDLAVSTGDDITFADSSKAIFGAGSDLQIYSDGTTGQVTGNVNVTGSVTADGLVVDGAADIDYQSGATNNTAPDTLKVSNKTTGVHAAGLGASIKFEHTNSSASYSGSRISNVSNADPFTSNLSFYPYNYGYKEAMRISSIGDISFYEDTGTTPKLFWDASAEALRVGSTAAIFTNSVISGVSALGPTLGAKQTVAAQSAGGFWNSDTGTVNLVNFYAGAGGTQVGSIEGSSTGVSLFGTGGTGLTVYGASGNVGIGVSPNYPIHVEKSVGGDWLGKFKNTHATNGYGLLIHAGDDASVTALSVGNYAGAGDYLVVKGDGNVGIGTATPDQSLVVNGQIGLSYDGTNSYQGLKRSGVGTVYYTGTTSGATDAIHTFTGSGDAAKMTILEGGNVGIGTSAPQTSLAIETSGTQDVVSPIVTGQSSSVTYGGLYTVRDGAGDQRGLALKVYTANVGLNEAMRIDSSGNVGIGGNGTGSGLGVFLSKGTGSNFFEASDGTKTMITGTDSTQDFVKIGSLSAHPVGFVVGNSERMRIDASGNLLVRHTSPQVSDTHNGGTVEQFWGNQFSSSNSTNTKVMIGTGSSEGYVGASRLSSSGQYVVNSYIRFDNTNATAGSDAGQILFFTQTGGTNAAERMRISSDGFVRVNTTAQSNVGTRLAVWAESGSVSIETRCKTNVTYFPLANYNSSGSYIGGINASTTATSLATSSDQRLKENIADADDAGSKVDAIQVRQFDWIANNSHQDYGMVAQELQEVIPDVIHVSPDADNMLSVDYAGLVPMMLKEIQSLRARVAQLES